MVTAVQSERRGDWVQTFTGRKFWPLDPRPEDVDVRDIAHALSLLCRFTGHSRTFYSVAQHSVLASQIVPPESALAALLHDAAEAYMGDIARPWKRFLSITFRDADGDTFSSTLKGAEDRLLDVLVVALGGPPASNEAAWGPVAKADEILLVTEARDLMSPLTDGWHHVPANGFAILPELIEPWAPERAEREFLQRFATLTGTSIPPVCSHPSQSGRAGHWVCNECDAVLAPLKAA
ncbi:hypothetical protein VT84_09200 [Gemmata sp. SH-PL17]|uniref:hypothetical protein n=1 Tax=Gemmata sp. SH-PL17 TaxID=1630693 RepID=UPI00078E9446|nr:hypothetical protein [Gemmata sp. SH-PL17]AMV24559.1 hypothetical protein VT84_09200 [Gemmata sp. SH-PL17]